MAAAAGRLRRAGLRFSLDDFGAGSTSLSKIAALPASTVKIDPSFIRQLGQAAQRGSAVSALLAMAERLGCDCIAEGVETLEQSQLLREHGWRFAQGFLLSPALGADQVPAVLGSLTSPANGSGPPLGTPVAATRASTQGAAP